MFENQRAQQKKYECKNVVRENFFIYYYNLKKTILVKFAIDLEKKNPLEQNLKRLHLDFMI